MDNIDENIKQTAELFNNKKSQPSSNQGNNINPLLSLPSNASNSPSFRDHIKGNIQKQ
jgi:hypothetical protein